MFEHLPNDWKKALTDELTQEYIPILEKSIENKYLNQTVYPPKENVFTAFNLCPLKKVKVVILGQDPYHGLNQAHGLSFSVPADQKIPPSLQNIYKEIKNDIGSLKQTTGNLESWAKQGVLLLNATLTVAAGTPGSHQGLGWEQFTDAAIRKISDEKQDVVFLLWGRYAMAKESLIDQSKHLVLKAPHPSPFSAYTGFFGCRHFSQSNKYLEKTGQNAIDW